MGMEDAVRNGAVGSSRLNCASGRRGCLSSESRSTPTYSAESSSRLRDDQWRPSDARSTLRTRVCTRSQQDWCAPNGPNTARGALILSIRGRSGPVASAN